MSEPKLKKFIGRGSGIVAVEIPFTPRAKRILELAFDIAKQLGHDHIDTEHILMAIYMEHEGVAMRVLENLNADLYHLLRILYGEDILN